MGKTVSPYQSVEVVSAVTGSAEAECCGGGKGGSGVGKGSIDPSHKMPGPIPPTDNIKSTGGATPGGRK